MPLNTLRYLPFLLLAACQSAMPENKTERSEVAAFIETLKKASAQQRIEKTVSSQGRNETVLLPKPDLNRELSFFSKALLSDAYLKGYYAMSTKEQPGRTVQTYKATSEKPEVRRLQIIRDGTGQIIGLHMETVQNNYLYENTLDATLFAYTGKRHVLREYRVDGRQKMLFGDPYQFNIYGKAL